MKSPIVEFPFVKINLFFLKSMKPPNQLLTFKQRKKRRGEEMRGKERMRRDERRGEMRGEERRTSLVRKNRWKWRGW